MKNILIIDDNRMLRNSISEYLGFMVQGCTIMTAEDGQTGIEMLKSNPVNLVLTDLEMPGIDGYRVIEYAKNNHPDVPVIIMTGSWSADLSELVSKTGIVRCLEKPFRFEDLNEMVQAAFKEGRAI